MILDGDSSHWYFLNNKLTPLILAISCPCSSDFSLASHLITRLHSSPSTIHLPPITFTCGLGTGEAGGRKAQVHLQDTPSRQVSPQRSSWKKTPASRPSATAGSPGLGQSPEGKAPWPRRGPVSARLLDAKTQGSAEEEGLERGGRAGEENELLLRGRPSLVEPHSGLGSRRRGLRDGRRTRLRGAETHGSEREREGRGSRDSKWAITYPGPSAEGSEGISPLSPHPSPQVASRDLAPSPILSYSLRDQRRSSAREQATEQFLFSFSVSRSGRSLEGRKWRGGGGRLGAGKEGSSSVTAPPRLVGVRVVW